MSLSWEEFKNAITALPSTDQFTARISTISGDDAVFITEQKTFGSTFLNQLLGTSSTYRVTPNTFNDLKDREPEYIQLLLDARLRGFDIGRGLRKGKEVVEKAAFPAAALIVLFVIVLAATR